jgi:hypothetical protein
MQKAKNGENCKKTVLQRIEVENRWLTTELDLAGR